MRLPLLALTALLAAWCVPDVARAQGAETDREHGCRGPACLELAPTYPPTPLPQHSHELGIDWAAVSQGAASVFFRFLGNLAPSSNGVVRVGIYENPLTDLEVPIGDSQFGVVVLGNGNNYALTPLLGYREYNGIIGLRYQFLPPAPFQISLTASPLYTTLANVSVAPGLDPEGRAPGMMVLGGAGGLDVSYTADVVRFEGHAYAMPGADVFTGNVGVRTLQVLQVTFFLHRLLALGEETPIELALQGLHVDRGDAEESIYELDLSRFRSARELREAWQGMAFITVRRE